MNLDSLWGIWNDETKPDTARLIALETIAWKGYLFSKPDSAFYFSQIVYDFAKARGLKMDEAVALNTQGVSYLIRGQNDKAIDFFKRNLVIMKEIGNKRKIAACLNNIGLVYYNEGDYFRAMQQFDQSIKLDEQSGNKNTLDRAYNNMGLIYFAQGNYARAFDCYMRSLMIRKELNVKKGIAAALDNIAMVYYRQGDVQSAITYNSESLSIREQIGDNAGVARSLTTIGVIQKEQGSYENAVESQTRCLEIYEVIGNRKGVALTLNNLGGIYLKQANYLRATEYFNRSLKMKKEMGDKKGMAHTLNDLGVLNYRSGNIKEAQDFSQKAALLAVEVGIISQAKIASLNMYKCHMWENSFGKAGQKLQEVMELVDSELKTNFPLLSEKEKEQYFKTISGYFDFTHDFALLAKDAKTRMTGEAYNQALMIKGLLLKSSTMMRNTILNSTDTLLIDQYFNWISVKRRIAKTYSKGGDVSELEEEANELEKDLVKGSQEFSDIKKVENLRWKDVQSGLKDGESAIEFVRFTHQEDYRNDSGKVELYAALIINNKSKHPKMIGLFEEPELEKILGTFPGNNLSYIEQVYGTKENLPTGQAGTKSQLYDLIWEPMEEELTGAKKVYVSPVGLLHKISFAALAKEQDVYLCDLYEIETQSSTGKIAMPSKIAYNENSSTTLFGGIDYNSDSTSSEIWNYLDGSLSETKQIEKILKKQKRPYNYFSMANATEEEFKRTASNSNILHIATHGFFYADPDEVLAASIDQAESKEDIVFRGGTSGFAVNSFVKSRNPLMRSGLVFAGANDVWNRSQSTNDSTYTEDGVLTAAEVATIDMRNCDLVVLSACETGLGDIKGSEGVYGLQRSFKMAGVKYLIMSLWQVPDKETAEFMTSFYKNLTKTNDIKKSFNLTQQEMRKKYDPYYWAAFVLVE